jgi:hypothetical protein
MSVVGDVEVVESAGIQLESMQAWPEWPSRLRRAKRRESLAAAVVVMANSKRPSSDGFEHVE